MIGWRPAYAGLAAGALVFACLALASGLDRLSSGSGASRFVPNWLQPQTFQQEARKALGAGQAERAIVSASQALRNAPIEPASSALLGSAHFMAGRNREAHDAFTVAAQLGWRDVPTQAYWIFAGLALGDRKLAVRRLDALMRAAPTLPQSHEVLVRIESDPRGRAALLERLAAGPGWLSAYAAASSTLGPVQLAQRLSLLEAAGLRGRRVPCSAVADSLNNLAYQQLLYAEARRLWLTSCGIGTAGLVSDPGFAGPLREPITPFDWILPGAGGVASGLLNGVLVAQNNSSTREVVARQLVLAPPGPARLQWRTMAGRDPQAMAQSVTLLCPNGSEARIVSSAVAGDTAGHFQIDLSIAPDCWPQTLIVRIPREVGEARFDDVILISGRATVQ